MNIQNLSAQQLRKAADLTEQIEGLQNELSKLLGGEIPIPFKRGPKKGGMSAAGRARIAEAQRKRWAKQKGQAVKAEKKPAKRKMSAAGKARIIAAQKARWAKFKAKKKA